MPTASGTEALRRTKELNAFALVFYLFVWGPPRIWRRYIEFQSANQREK